MKVFRIIQNPDNRKSEIRITEIPDNRCSTVIKFIYNFSEVNFSRLFIPPLSGRFAFGIPRISGAICKNKEIFDRKIDWRLWGGSFGWFVGVLWAFWAAISGNMSTLRVVLQIEITASREPPVDCFFCITCCVFFTDRFYFFRSVETCKICSRVTRSFFSVCLIFILCEISCDARLVFVSCVCVRNL